MRLLLALVALVILFFSVVGCGSVQRKLLYFPTHETGDGGLTPWKHADGRLLGFSREVSSPAVVWLFLHGNGGQAFHRAYALPAFSDRDSVFILEYPGYGTREGTPSLASFNAAALEACEILRHRFPNTPVCVASESIGSGPACALAATAHPPDKLVLIVPFDVLSAVAGEHYPLLPVRLLLHDNWDNVAALSAYRGPLEIFAAIDDRVIPSTHAEALAASRPQAVIHFIAGGHNDWAQGDKVRIRFLP